MKDRRRPKYKAAPPEGPRAVLTPSPAAKAKAANEARAQAQMARGMYHPTTGAYLPPPCPVGAAPPEDLGPAVVSMNVTYVIPEVEQQIRTTIKGRGP